MNSIDRATYALIGELCRLQSPDAYNSLWSAADYIPGQISVGEDRFLTTSPELERQIRAIAKELKSEQADLATTYTDEEWASAVRREIGPPLAEIDLDAERSHSAETILGTIRARLSEQVAAIGTWEYAFGCSLFGAPEMSAFSIGPVLFESRISWLRRKTGEGSFADSTRRRIERIWSGDRLRKRRPSLEASLEREIIDTVGACFYVCSVRTDKLAPAAARQKALFSGRLALAAISLRWETPSKALRGLWLLPDGGHRNQYILGFRGDGMASFAATRSGLPHGPSVSQQEWSSQLETSDAIFKVVGETINQYVQIGKTTSPMSSTILQALNWFHEGCREEYHLIAIVKLSAALDSLGGGEKSGGILRFISARTGWTEKSKITPEGITLKEAIGRIYGLGRSRAIHGTNDQLGHDWESTRSLAESLCRVGLLRALDWVSEHGHDNKPNLMQRP